MAGKAHQTPLMEEFEPFCKWQRGEDSDILELYLQDFKKEQLTVQISNQGTLKISGERLDGSKSTKFYKEVSLQADKYDTAAVHAKFLKGCLYITLPKLKKTNQKMSYETSKSNDQNQTTSNSEHIRDQSAGSGKTIPPKDYTNGGGTEQKLATPGQGENVSTDVCQFRNKKRPSSGLKLRKVAVSLVATATAVAVLVAYVIYMYKSTIDEVDDSII